MVILRGVKELVERLTLEARGYPREEEKPSITGRHFHTLPVPCRKGYRHNMVMVDKTSAIRRQRYTPTYLQKLVGGCLTNDRGHHA